MPPGHSDFYTLCGERDQAIDTMQRLKDTDAMYPYGTLRLEVFYDGLRGDPRFEALVASLAPKPDLSAKK